MAERPYTTKQMGDAGEMLVAAELTLQGIPSFIVPSNWPGYDVVAQCPERGLQRISVKTRTKLDGNFVGYSNDDDFDWLAVVILPSASSEARRIFIVPSTVAHQRSYEAKHRNGRGFRVNKVITRPVQPLPDPIPRSGCGLADYENNFCLSPEPCS